MFNHTDLVGIRFTASIGEPWDFVSSAGQNKLEGKILAVTIAENGQPRLLCSISPFTISGVVVNQVVGVNRYVGSQNLIESLKSGEEATMNFAFTNLGHEISEESVASMITNNSFTSFLVGSMKLNP